MKAIQRASRRARRTSAEQPQAPSSRTPWPLVAALGVAAVYGLGLLSGAGLADAGTTPGEAPRTGTSRERSAPAESASVAEPRVPAPRTWAGPLPAEAASAEASPVLGPAVLPTEEHEHGGGCAHGPGGTIDAAAMAEAARQANELLGCPPAILLAALRSGDAELETALAEALLNEPAALWRPELVAGLLELARDAGAGESQRLIALELVGRAPGSDAATVAALAQLVRSEALDGRLRWVALDGIRLLALERSDLRAASRAALLQAAEETQLPELRADALVDLRSEGASPDELARLGRFLADPQPQVRSAAARALGDSDPAARADVAADLQRALWVEEDAVVAANILAAAVRVGRARAGALLGDMAAAPIVLTTPSLGRQAADYRALLAEGETDPLRVLRTREAREDARLAALDPAPPR